MCLWTELATLDTQIDRVDFSPNSYGKKKNPKKPLPHYKTFPAPIFMVTFLSCCNVYINFYSLTVNTVYFMILSTWSGRVIISRVAHRLGPPPAYRPLKLICDATKLLLLCFGWNSTRRCRRRPLGKYLHSSKAGSVTDTRLREKAMGGNGPWCD